MNVFTQRLRLAANYMAEHGWVQGKEMCNEGVCLTGAVRYCAPQTGDEYLIRAVLRHLGTGEDWNDAENRTEPEVLNVLRKTKITDSDLQQTFGPQWREIVTLIRQAEGLTRPQTKLLETARTSVWAATRNVHRDAARTAAWKAARDADRIAAWKECRDAARDAARGSVEPWEAGEAVAALVVRDLISPEHFDALYGPWGSVFGDPVPCD